ncbi:MAG: septum formation initiator family protein [SAR324 cluster bacterium]|nr:septum formation initiator family protein [SAR324 cluster bacterium]
MDNFFSNWRFIFSEVSVSFLIKIIILYFTFIFLFGDRGLLHLAISYQKFQKLAEEVATLNKEKDELSSITRLSKEKTKIEVIAKEKLGLIYPHERVIFITKNAK